MRQIGTFFYLIGEGIKGMFRNRVYTLASIATIMATLTLLGTFYTITRNLTAMLDEAQSVVGLTVFFNEGTSEGRILEIKEEVAKRVEVAEVHYISPDEAWEKYKQESLSEELAAVFGNDNPLKDSASLEVKLSDVTMQDILVRYLRNIDGVRKVNFSESMAEAVAGIRDIVQWVSLGLIIMLAAVAIFLIRTTVTNGITVRREEISIMSIIGSTDFFMEFPFVVEGILIGVLGSILPIALIQVLYNRICGILINEFGSIFSSLKLLPVEVIIKDFIPIAIAFGVGIGLFSSWVTAAKHVRKIAVEHF